jgi:hypothetical protein
MQFHLEVDDEKLRRWSMLDSDAYRDLQQRHATVQGGAARIPARGGRTTVPRFR